MKKYFLHLALGLIGLYGSVSCDNDQENLTIFGPRTWTGSDTLYHTIGSFQFINQDSAWVTKKTVKNKIYVADFFFTSCRSICPIMKREMLRVYEATEKMSDVILLSHSIDPQYDNVPVLHEFAERLGVKSDRWHFLTGAKDSIFKIAEKSYFLTAKEDKTEPDGFIHSGAFLLIDKEGRIRGKYDGTDTEDVNRLIREIKILRLENGSK